MYIVSAVCRRLNKDSFTFTISLIHSSQGIWESAIIFRAGRDGARPINTCAIFGANLRIMHAQTGAIFIFPFHGLCRSRPNFTPFSTTVGRH